MSPYHHLTIEERETIFLLHSQNNPLRVIARTLRRSCSTISRELKRNDNSYSPSKAQRQYNRNKARCGRHKVLGDPKTLNVVQHLFLDWQWSPEEISARLKFEHSKIQISYSTIYRAVYSGAFDKDFSRYSRGAIRKLRHHGKSRHTKGYQEHRGKIRVSNSIDDRPLTATNRSKIGHWELDTVAGKTGHSCIVTMVDRKSRYLFMTKAEKKSSIPVTTAIDSILADLPPQYLASITPDRGKEFSKHTELTDKYGVEFYFPYPHAPWQRGTSENTNGLIREYLPKAEDMDPITNTRIQEYQELINKRPRKCLGWKTPFEVFTNELLHLI